MEIIRNKIRQIRQQKEYSQEFMAAKLGISQAAYSKIENGETEITFTRLVSIARLLDINPVLLISAEPQPVNGSVTDLQPQFVNGSVTDLQTLAKLYERHIHHLEEEIRFLRSLLARWQTDEKPNEVSEK